MTIFLIGPSTAITLTEGIKFARGQVSNPKEEIATGKKSRNNELDLAYRQSAGQGKVK